MNVKHPDNSFKLHVRSRRGSVIGRVLGALACQALLAWSAHADAAWFHSDWPNRRKVTIAAALAPETLTNFPVLVQFSDQTNVLFRMCQTNGQDIVFTAADGVTRLAHEIDSYSARGTKLLNAWVRVPELSPSSDTVLYMYYGNPAVADQQDRANLWADYAGVWHLEEDLPGSNTATVVYRDSTTNACHGRDCVSTNSVAGRVGNGANLDGDDYVQFIRTLNTTNDFTITAWARPTRLSWEAIIGDATSRYLMLFSASALIGRSAVSNAVHTETYGTNAGLTTDAWQHVVFRSTGENGAVRTFYKNGAALASSALPVLSLPLSADPWSMIGKWGSTDARYFHGVLDEVRVSDKTLPTAWFDAEYRNASSPAAYVTFGPEEGSGAAPWPSLRFAYRQEILVWPGVTAAALTNFPMLVAVTNQDNHVFSVAEADGRDIMFTDIDGVTRLPHEIERYAAVAPSSLYAWVRVPVLHAAAPTRLYLYYGRNSSFDRPDKTNVWSEGYLGVWHLNEAVSNGQTNYDSSASAAHGVFKDPSGRGGGDAVGKIAGADEFAGFDDHYVLTPGVLCSSNGFTVSAWVNDAKTNAFRIYESGLDNRNYAGVNASAAGIVSVHTGQGQRTATTASGAIREGVWHYLVGVCAAPNTRIYRDGVYVAPSASFTNLTAQLRGLYIGRYVSPNYAFNGRVDELRISGVTRTPEWIKACYLSQNEPGAYLSFEPPEVNVSVGTLISIF